MATIVTRAGKGSALTNSEVDANFNNLNTDKVEVSSRDAVSGVVGVDATNFRIRTKNALGTFINFFTNATTAARTWTFPDKDGTVAMLSDIGTGAASGITNVPAGNIAAVNVQAAINELDSEKVAITNLKTINTQSLLGGGDLNVQASLVAGTNIKNIGGVNPLGSGDVTTPVFTGAVGGASFVPSSVTVPTNGMYLPGTNILGWATNNAERFRVDASGVFSYLGNIVSRMMIRDSALVYFDSGATNALDYTNGSHQRWTPATGAQSLTVTNWPPTGNLGQLFIEGVNLGAATITWLSGVNWVKNDGTLTTVFASNGVTLQAAGTDFVLLWTRDAGTTVYGKVMR